jgi:hypothetical protein
MTGNASQSESVWVVDNALSHFPVTPLRRSAFGVPTFWWVEPCPTHLQRLVDVSAAKPVQVQAPDSFNDFAQQDEPQVAVDEDFSGARFQACSANIGDYGFLLTFQAHAQVVFEGW